MLRKIGHPYLAPLQARSLRRKERSLRSQARQEAETAINALARLLTAPEQFDPLVKMQADEERFDPLALIQHSYSQAAAYVILLHRFDWDLEALAEHLRLVTASVRGKVIACGIHMKTQPSLFDRIHSIELGFRPTIARRVARCPMSDSRQIQLGWEFTNRPRHLPS